MFGPGSVTDASVATQATSRADALPAGVEVQAARRGTLRPGRWPPPHQSGGGIHAREMVGDWEMAGDGEWPATGRWRRRGPSQRPGAAGVAVRRGSASGACCPRGALGRTPPGPRRLGQKSPVTLSCS